MNIGTRRVQLEPVVILAAALTITLALAECHGAGAQPPPGADPNSAVGQWFRSLTRADGVNCCSESDCRPAEKGELSDVGGSLSINLNGRLQPVPESKIVWREDNPLGKPIVCRTRAAGWDSTLYCVVPAGGI